MQGPIPKSAASEQNRCIAVYATIGVTLTTLAVTRRSQFSTDSIHRLSTGVDKSAVCEKFSTDLSTDGVNLNAADKLCITCGQVGINRPQVAHRLIHNSSDRMKRRLKRAFRIRLRMDEVSDLHRTLGQYHTVRFLNDRSCSLTDVQLPEPSGIQLDLR